MRVFMTWIKDSFRIITISLVLFLLTDFLVTWVYGARGFSKFFISNSIEGRINKPGFSGFFGNVLEEFHGQVTIGKNGERISEPVDCGHADRKILFLGDSTTAGFEVDDDETFISILNKDCNRLRISGVNFGVRAHDTHAVNGTYKRIAHELDHNFVVYVMTQNDFSENVNPNAYRMMTRKFGRRYENNLVQPDEDFIFSIYAALRISIGDRLSLTTFIITKIERFLRPQIAVGKSNKLDSKIINTEVTKAFHLIEELAIMVEAQKATLVIVPFPLIDMPDVTRDKKNTILSALINKNLESVLYIEDIDSRVASKVNEDSRYLFEMGYKRDGHLSEYGHYIMSEVLIDILQP